MTDMHIGMLISNVKLHGIGLDNILNSILVQSYININYLKHIY